MRLEARLKRAVFLDRDGTLSQPVLNRDGLEDSPFRPEDVVLMPGAGDFTRRLRDAGFATILITNQPGVAKGSIAVAELDKIHQQLSELLSKEGGGLDGIYYCPHHPVGRSGIYSRYVRVCDCRKPAPGMLLKAANELCIDLSRSWIVGDRLSDIQAGHAAGCRTVLLTRCAIGSFSDDSEPTKSAHSLFEAFEAILDTKEV